MRNAVWLAVAFGSCLGIPAQQAAEKVNAGRLVKYIELPAKKQQAVRELLRLGKEAVPALARAMLDPRPEVVCTVASILRALGPAAAAAQPALEKVAGGADPRCAAAARWALTGVGPREGVVLVSAGNDGEARVLDLETGKQVGESITLRKKVFDCERLPNGNFLTANWGKHEVREITPKGDVVWSYGKLGAPMDADALPNGNVLIADMSKGFVREVDRSGKTVWEFKSPDPYGAERLPGGNTLIADFKGHVVEVDPKGKVVWRHECLAPMGATRLPDGNTLIASWTNKVFVVAPDKKVVRTIGVPFSSYVARLLPGGDIVVSGDAGVARVDAQGKVKWQVAVRTAGSLEIY